jgi:hypothetical protein
MPNRETVLRTLMVGDIFHAQSPNGASLVCVVTALDDGTILARRIHTQDDLRFERKTGIEIENVKAKARIDCVAPFPPDVHRIFVEMDRKYQQLYDFVRNGKEFDWELCKMTPDERRADSYIDRHVSANKI